MTAQESNDKKFEKVKAAVDAGELSIGEALEKFKMTSAAYYTRLNKTKKRGAKPLKEAKERVTMTELQGTGLASGKTLLIVTSDPDTVEKVILGFMRGEA